MRIWWRNREQALKKTSQHLRRVSHNPLVERELFPAYLIECVVGSHCHSVGVQHQSLSQECKETVCVHDLHLPPVEITQNNHTTQMVASCGPVGSSLHRCRELSISLPSQPRQQELGSAEYMSPTARCHKVGCSSGATNNNSLVGRYDSPRN